MTKNNLEKYLDMVAELDSQTLSYEEKQEIVHHELNKAQTIDEMWDVLDYYEECGYIEHFNAEEFVESLKHKYINTMISIVFIVGTPLWKIWATITYCEMLQEIATELQENIDYIEWEMCQEYIKREIAEFPKLFTEMLDDIVNPQVSHQEELYEENEENYESSEIPELPF